MATIATISNAWRVLLRMRRPLQSACHERRAVAWTLLLNGHDQNGRRRALGRLARNVRRRRVSARRRAGVLLAALDGAAIARGRSAGRCVLRRWPGAHAAR